MAAGSFETPKSSQPPKTYRYYRDWGQEGPILYQNMHSTPISGAPAPHASETTIPQLSSMDGTPIPDGNIAAFQNIAAHPDTSSTTYPPPAGVVDTPVPKPDITGPPAPVPNNITGPPAPIPNNQGISRIPALAPIPNDQGTSQNPTLVSIQNNQGIPQHSARDQPAMPNVLQGYAGQSAPVQGPPRPNYALNDYYRGYPTSTNAMDVPSGAANNPQATVVNTGNMPIKDLTSAQGSGYANTTSTDIGGHRSRSRTKDTRRRRYSSSDEESETELWQPSVTGVSDARSRSKSPLPQSCQSLRETQANHGIPSSINLKE